MAVRSPNAQPMEDTRPSTAGRSKTSHNFFRFDCERSSSCHKTTPEFPDMSLSIVFLSAMRNGVPGNVEHPEWYGLVCGDI